MLHAGVTESAPPAAHVLQIDAVEVERRIRPFVRDTPFERSKWLSELNRGAVYLKHESLQETGSFKLRGAANKLLSLPPAQAARGVVTASNGNHALAVAAMGQHLDIPVRVFVPASIDPIRRKRIAALGAVVDEVNGDCLNAEEHARRTTEYLERTYVSPYNDTEVIAGQATIAVELLRRAPRLDAVFAAVGGGGLIGGIGAHFKAVAPFTRIIGCWPFNAPALFECLHAEQIVETAEKPTLSVSTAGGIEADSVTLGLCRRVIDQCVLVTEEDIFESLRDFYRQENRFIEGAAAVAVAGFRKVASDFAGRKVAIIIGGSNVDPALVARITEGP